MTVRCYRSVRPLVRDAEVFSKVGRPFQSVFVLAGVTNIVNRIWGMIKGFGRIRFYVAYQDETPVLVVPLYLKAGVGRVIGSGRERMDYVDFLYNAKLKERWKEALEVVMGRLKHDGIAEVVADFVPADSPLFSLKDGIEKTGETLNASISLQEFPSHADYFAHLGKSPRQNVRTAYNRLRRDGHMYRLVLGDSINNRELSDTCQKLYLNRQSVRYGWGGVIHYIGAYFASYFRLSLCDIKVFSALLTIDNEPAAMLQGYENSNAKSIEVPELAINEKFSFYSPGMILVNEVCRYLIEEKHYNALDLARGTEKYKKDMGGTIYKTYSILLKL